MDPLLGLLLFLHIGGAIIAFGPTFAYSIIGAMGGKEPQHANFALRVSHRINDRLVEPLVIWVGLTGLGLIIVGQRDLLGRDRWLLVAIAVYLTALTFALTVQRKTVLALIDATSGPPPGAPGGGGVGAAGAPEASGPAAAGAPVGGPAAAGAHGAAGGPPAGGPPPHIAALLGRVQRGGMFLSLLLVVILALMVFKPSF
jgi:hypothetical protein